MPVRVKEDAKYELTHKVGTISFDYGVRGPELESELRKAGEKFVKDMANRGLTLYQPPGGYLRAQDGSLMTNPSWVKHANDDDNGAAPFYAIDWTGERPRKERKTDHVDSDGRHIPNIITLPTKREASLEETEGMVEYRIVGIFWAPQVQVDIVSDRQQRLAAERAAKNPVVFGSTGNTGR